MNENTWSILAEFTHSLTSENLEQASSATKAALEGLNLPDIFLQRLNMSLMETITDHIQRSDKSQSASMMKIRILCNCVNAQTELTASWGFFFIEQDHLIELYLYQDQK